MSFATCLQASLGGLKNKNLLTHIFVVSNIKEIDSKSYIFILCGFHVHKCLFL